MRTSALFVSLLALSCIVSAQTFMGGLSGTVKDASGGAIPSARITVTNVATGKARDATANESGSFVVTALRPGMYRVEANAAGFKKYLQNIELRVQQFATLDVALEIGEASQSIEVRDQVPLLDASTSSLSQTVENRQVTELPSNGRNPLAFVSLTPGIRLQAFAGQNLATTNWTGWGNFSINGGISNSNEILVDGAPVTMAELNNPVYIPPVDAVQEFRVQTNNFSAEFGRSSGGVVNISIKSGTNGVHGNLYEFLRNRPLNANDYFQNRVGKPRPALAYNQYGGSVGGPIVRNKSFFFINLESFRQRLGQSLTTTVPTALQRAGDFSQDRNGSGASISVGDPLTTVRNPDGSYSRQAFPSNLVPSSRINPVAKNIMNILWPLPNAPGQAFTNVNNFVTSASVASDSDQGVIRIDHNINNKWKLFGTYSHQYYTPGQFDAFGNKTTIVDVASDTKRIQNAVVAATAVLTPALVGEFRTAFVRFALDRKPLTLGYDLTTLGFPKSLVDQLQFLAFPVITVVGVQGLHNSTSSVIPRYSNNWSESGSLTWVKGGHTLKMGTQYRVLQLNDLQNNQGTPTFNFDARFTSTNPLQTTATSGVGFGSYLLGYPSGASVSKVQALADQRWYAAFFVQDDWKLTSKLTLNLGLQYSLDSSITERYNRTTWFDPTVTPAMAQKVGLPLRGGLQFATKDTRSPVDLNRKQFGPRFGFAHQLRSSTVLRGGYGVFWLPNNLQTANTGANAPAWNVTTPFVSSLDGGITTKDTLSNPYPNGILEPPGSAAGPDTLIGQSLTIYMRGMTNAGYMQQWNFGVQHQLLRDLAVDLAYAGSKGTRLPADVRLDQIAPQYLLLGNAMNNQVPNPFYGQVASGTLAQPTVAAGQLARPYPQFTAVTMGGAPVGSSVYHSLQAKVTKRFATSLMVFVYTFGKALGDSESRVTWADAGVTGGFMDDYNRRVDRSLAALDVSQRFVFQYNLELPFGGGRRYLSNAGKAGWLVSGWELTGIYTAQSGTPLLLTTASNVTNSYGGGSRPNNNGTSGKITGDAHERLNKWFETSAFSQPAPFTFGNTAKTLPDVRTHGVNNLEAGIFKNNYFGQDHRFNLQFRSEFLNMFNRVKFGAPGTTLGTPQFGIVSSQGNDPRFIQFALKFLF